ncbi:hypothetical protein BJ508DRAFT_415285, partial [Ascobolus immersus RN42]
MRYLRYLLASPKNRLSATLVQANPSSHLPCMGVVTAKDWEDARVCFLGTTRRVSRAVAPLVRLSALLMRGLQGGAHRLSYDDRLFRSGFFVSFLDIVSPTVCGAYYSFLMAAPSKIHPQIPFFDTFSPFHLPASPRNSYKAPPIPVFASQLLQQTF